MGKRPRQRSLFEEPTPQPDAVRVAPPDPPTNAASEDGSITPDLTDKTVWVVDAHNVIYQVFHAVRELTSPSGEPVGATMGFSRDLFGIIEDQAPDYLLCAFDMPGDTFRNDLYDQYKANRPPMPEELRVQIARIRELLGLMEIPALGVEGYEADDVLATVSRIVEEAGGRCVLVTSDKDCRQLLSDQTSIYLLRKQSYYGADELKADWGVAPNQVVDFQALVGDTSDNVPGVPLIGPKIAGQLLHDYGTLDGVLDNADKVSGAKRKQNLLEGREVAELSRKLVRLDRETPVAIDWNLGRAGGGDAEAVKEIFQELDIRTLAARAEKLFGEGSGRAAVESPKVEATYHLVDTPDAFAAFLEQLKQQACISFDLETTSVMPRWADIVGYAFAWDAENAYYLPVRAPEDAAKLDADATLEALRPILEDENVRKIGQNLKYDMVVLRSAGVEMRGLEFDTMVAAYLLDAGRRNHNLDDLAKQYLGHVTIKYKDLCGTGKDQKRIDEVDTRAVADYAGEDALIPVLLRPMLEERLRAAELVPLWETLERPMVEALVEIEYNGVRVDTDRLAELSETHGALLERLEQEIYETAGREFNIASPKQLQEILFTELKLPVKKKTQTGASTDVEVLQELAPLHPLPGKIIEYRQSAKLKSTYIDALPEMVCPKTGRIHASFNQVVTATGRLSSSDPNLQNIPVRTSEGRAIRSAFIAGEEGWRLLCADYSQIELRVLAHFTEDPNLCAAFERDEDIHARVASEVFHVPLEEVEKDQRRKAKAVNFGVIYGQSAFGLARTLGIDRTEAAAFIDAYFQQYPGIQAFLDRVIDDCREKGYVSTILGRRRAIQGLPQERSRQTTLAERTAINTVIQGSAADLIKQAMINVHRRLRSSSDLSGRMLLQIHDELVFETPHDERDRLAEMVVAEMSGAFELRVPLKVDVKAGPNWEDAEGI